MVKIATQIMSRACQKMLRQSSRRTMCGWNPLAQICAIIVPIHSKPAVTCAPWQPTSVKKDERKALRCGPRVRAPYLFTACYVSVHTLPVSHLGH